MAFVFPAAIASVKPTTLHILSTVCIPWGHPALKLNSQPWQIQQLNCPANTPPAISNVQLSNSCGPLLEFDADLPVKPVQPVADTSRDYSHTSTLDSRTSPSTHILTTPKRQPSNTCGVLLEFDADLPVKPVQPVADSSRVYSFASTLDRLKSPYISPDEIQRTAPLLWKAGMYTDVFLVWLFSEQIYS